jgi:hypothetical protein
MSILGTHVAEAKSMSGLYLPVYQPRLLTLLSPGSQSKQLASMFLPASKLSASFCLPFILAGIRRQIEKTPRP